MRIALVHDYLNEAGGAERVLRVLADMYPQVPIYTAFAKNGTAIEMIDARRQRIVESRWGWMLKIGRLYSYGRFLLPWVWKSIDLTDYDVVITSCSGYIARGFRVRLDAKVVAYCHTPPRWLYGYDTPTGAQRKWWGQLFMWVTGPFMRYFDYQSAQRVNVWLANSQEVANRIEKFYRKKAKVVYPPIDITYTRKPGNQYIQNKQKRMYRYTDIRDNDYYLVVSRIVGGKGIEEAVRGAQKAGVKLKVVGEIVGTGFMTYDLGLKKSNVEYVGRVDDQELTRLYTGAKGFIALARDEDFGMTVVEAMLYGTPVLAFNGGGYKETILDPAHQQVSTSASQRIGEAVSQNHIQTGVLIDKTDANSVEEGIRRMEKIKWDTEAIKKWASKFGRGRFEKEVRRIVGA